jgi:alcohol dehydrogenase (cytochrome c)
MAIPGTIIVPMNGTDFGGLAGYVLGVDPASGNIQWKAAMIPGKGEAGADTWPEGSTQYGGAGPWISGSWDPELKMYYTGTANAYEWNPRNRGNGELDNLGAASIVAVDTTSGKVPWRYVAVPGDPFDYDVPQTPMVITIDGKKTVVQPNKTGYIHYLDAKTGQYLRAVPFVEKIDWAQGYDAKGRPINMAPVPKEGGGAMAKSAGRREHVSERVQPEDRRYLSRGHQLRHEVRSRGDQGHQQRATLRRVPGVHLR